MLQHQRLRQGETPAVVDALHGLGSVMEAAQLARGVADKFPDVNSQQTLATMFLEAHLDADAEKALNNYLKLNPKGDANAWADLAKLQFRAGRTQAAQQSFINGYQIDRNALFARLQKDEELYKLAAPLFQPRK